MNTTLNRLGSVKRFGDPWTETEEALMRLEYKIKGVRWMMKQTGRSKGSICAKAKAMGLSGKWILVATMTEWSTGTQLDNILEQNDEPIVKVKLENGND